MYFNVNKHNNVPVLTNTFGTDDIARINILSTKAKIDFEIPLFYENEGIKNKIGPISLIYSNNTGHEFDLGYGLGIKLINKINFVFAERENKVNIVQIKNSKYENINYELDENDDILYTEEDNTYMHVDYLKDESGEIIKWNKIYLCDTSGNYLIYENKGTDINIYPSYYHKTSIKGENDIEISVNASGVDFRLDDQEIHIDNFSSNTIKLAKFIVSGEELCTVKLIYEDRYLSSVIKYINYKENNGNTISKDISKKEYVFNNNEYIIVKNLINGFYTKYELDGNKKVTRYVNCFEPNEESGKETTISYDSENETRISNYKGQVTKYFFDNGKLVSCIDPFNKVITINYDSENNIVEKLNMMDISDVESAKRGNMIKTSEVYDEGTDKLILHNNYGSSYSSKIVTLDNVDIIKNSGLTFIMNCKKMNSVEEKLRIKIKLINTTNNEYEEHTAYSSLIRSRFLPISKMFISNNNYNKVEITIENVGSNNKYEISNIQLYNHLYGSITHYNEYGKVSKTYNGENVLKRSYIKEDKTLLLTSSGSDKNASIYNYDAKGNIIEVINANGTKVLYEYDAFNNLIKQTLINEDNSYFEKTYTYTEDGTRVLSETNEDGLVIIYEYVRNNRLISKITHNNGLVEDFTYNNSFDITKHKINKSITDSVDIDYLYDSFRRVYEIKLDNNYSYKFYYDDYGNITNTYIKKNDLLYTIDTLEYETKNEVYTENVRSHKVGNIPNRNNLYFYEYDEKNNLKKIYLNSMSDPNLIYEFIYDVNNNLVRIIDSKNSETINFTYDEYGNLVSDEKIANGLVVKTNYKYDLKKNILFEEHKVNNQTIDLYSYSVGKKEIKSPIHLYNYYKNYDKDLYSCFLLTKSNNGPYRFSLSNNKDHIELMNQNQQIETTNLYANSTTCFDFNELLDYNLDYNIKSDSENTNKTIICWFKNENSIVNNNNNNKVLLSVQDLNKTTDVVSLFINQDRKIQSNELGFISDTEIINNKWTFIALSLIKNGSNMIYKVNINGVNYTSTTINKLCPNNIKVSFGNYTNILNNTNRFIGKMTCLFVSNKALEEYEVSEIYKDTLDYFITYRKDSTNNIHDTDLITTRYLHMTSPLVPLNKSFESINDDLKYHFSERNTFNKEKDELFTYNKEYLKDYAYKVSGNDLVYENTFTGFIDIAFSTVSENSTSETLDSFIIELRNKTETNDDLVFTLSRQDDGLLCIKLYDLDLETNLFANNGLNRYCITIDPYYMDETTSEFIYLINLKLNDDINTFTYEYRSSSIINFNRIVLDKKDDSTYAYDSIINMLYINNSSSSIDLFSNAINTEKHIKTFDNLGRLYKEEVYKNDKRVYLKDILNHKKVVNGKNKCYNIIETEAFYSKPTDALEEDVQRAITYDYSMTTGNVTRRTYESQLRVLDESEYIYDKLGWLVEEKNISNNICTRYTYDDLGNIINIKKTNASNSTNISETNFVYNQIPIRLNSVSKDGIVSTINYSSSNFLLPISIVNSNSTKLFSWDGTNLSGYQLISGENILRDLNFEYDQQGRRIKKVSVDNISLGTITRSYRYSQNKLIEEYLIDELKGDEYKLHYLYDESGMLYGFEYGSNAYYYLRDSLQTIIGLIDENGEIVCEYRYDAYGNHKVLNSQGEEELGQYFIGNVNPFRYKGYYYDVETSLFWLSSRYYSPELCRFISPDDVSYLDPESVNGLNLYCYCKNNPIMYVDPSGHIAITTVIFAALIGGAIAAGTAYGVDVVTNFSDGFDWSDFNTFTEENLIKYACAFAGGAISGALGAFGSTGLQLLGTFVGEMVENAYTFTSWENVGQALIMSVFSTTLDGVLTVGKNRLARSYFDKGRSNLSTKANKQIKKFLNKGIDPTNIHASDLINRTYKYYNRLDNLTGSIHWLLTL